MSSVAPSRKGQSELWQLYRVTRDSAVRERLIIRYAPLVKYVAGRLAMGLPPSIEVDDLISYGVFGLIDAIDKFDLDREVKFETYAIARIRGAMLDGLRAYDWIPYSVRQKAKVLERTYSKLEGRLGRSATDAEVAAELCVTPAKLGKMLLDVRGLAVTSLDETWNGEDESGNGLRPIEVIEDTSAEDPVGRVEFEERKKLVAEAVTKLPEKERLVVALYYFEGLTAKEISHILKVSQSRISQLHSRAIMRLRGRLGADFMF
ncbi:MAG: FliA/WhiG family RNA polymerase sigma factor [Bacillota bacterium]|nr:FliA/WhiG family RNA polymerase sigma factor [Bacillota bacterium]